MTHRLTYPLMTGAAGLLLITTAWAGSPVWTFAPVPGYPSSVSLSPSETATVQYTVTNQSHKPHTLQIRLMQGIVSSGCTLPLGYHQSCTLNLVVNGRDLKGDVVGAGALRAGQS
jgi:hypothetical protein